MHPIIIAESQSICCIHVYTLNHMFWILRPDLVYILDVIKIDILHLGWWLFIIVLHPFPNSIILFLSSIIFLLCLYFFCLISLLIVNFLIVLLFVVHVIILIKLFILVFLIDSSTISIYFRVGFKGRIFQHLTKTLVDFHLCYFGSWS